MRVINGFIVKGGAGAVGAVTQSRGRPAAGQTGAIPVGAVAVTSTSAQPAVSLSDPIDLVVVSVTTGVFSRVNDTQYQIDTALDANDLVILTVAAFMMV